MIKLDTSENQVKFVYLGIGSNLGNKKNNIEKAKSKLLDNNIKILKTSSFYESLSWPNPNNPKFLNIVIKVYTNLDPLKLLDKCKIIEKDIGRKKSPKNAPRKCDIDVIDFRNIVRRDSIILPHPRMQSRNFVLFPLFQLNKDWRHPVSNEHIKSLILSLSDRDIRSIKQI